MPTLLKSQAAELLHKDPLLSPIYRLLYNLRPQSLSPIDIFTRLTQTSTDSDDDDFKSNKRSLQSILKKHTNSIISVRLSHYFKECQSAAIEPLITKKFIKKRVVYFVNQERAPAKRSCRPLTTVRFPAIEINISESDLTDLDEEPIELKRSVKHIKLRVKKPYSETEIVNVTDTSEIEILESNEMQMPPTPSVIPHDLPPLAIFCFDPPPSSKPAPTPKLADFTHIRQRSIPSTLSFEFLHGFPCYTKTIDSHKIIRLHNFINISTILRLSKLTKQDRNLILSLERKIRLIEFNEDFVLVERARELVKTNLVEFYKELEELLE